MSFLTSSLQDHLPSQCRLCGAWPCYGATRCCASCLRQWAQTKPRCPGCARPMPESRSEVRSCGACLTTPGPLTGVVAAMDYAFPWSRWAIDLKSDANQGLARCMAPFMVNAWRRSGPTHEFLIWTGVPLHPDKLRLRGFNQAWQLARRCQSLIEPGHSLAAPDVLRRTRWQGDQHKLPHHKRAAAVAQSFALAPHWRERLQASKTAVVIVDDVMTTGATLNACAQAILAHLQIPIYGLVFARTPPKSG